MRKVIMYNFVSLDGFFEGPNKELNWFSLDDGIAAYVKELVINADTFVFGRKTYEQMAAFWPTETNHDPTITERMNTAQKVVFSRTLPKVEWQNSRLAKHSIGEEVGQLKAQPGKDILILASGSLIGPLAEQGLIDEYQVIVHPVLLGGGTPLFNNVMERQKLKLVRTQPFPAGSVLLCYKPE
jgi:dihydrofolate reductase